MESFSFWHIWSNKTIYKLVSQQQICSKQDPGIYQACTHSDFLECPAIKLASCGQMGWGSADGHPLTCMEARSHPTEKCEHKGNQVTTHVEQESRVPGGVSKHLCILSLMTHERKDALRTELFWSQELWLIYIKAKKEM